MNLDWNEVSNILRKIPWKDVSDILRNVATVVGAILALIWFLTTRAYKRHSEIDLSCRAFPVTHPSEGTLAEISVVFENKGTRRQTLTNLTIHVEHCTEVKGTENKQLSLPHWTRLVTHKVPNLDPKSPFTVLRGISQEFTDTFVISPDIDLIRVTATFNSTDVETPKEGVAQIPYPSKRTARRVFDLRVKGIDKAGPNMSAA